MIMDSRVALNVTLLIGLLVYTLYLVILVIWNYFLMQYKEQSELLTKRKILLFIAFFF